MYACLLDLLSCCEILAGGVQNIKQRGINEVTLSSFLFRVSYARLSHFMLLLWGECVSVCLCERGVLMCAYVVVGSRECREKNLPQSFAAWLPADKEDKITLKFYAVLKRAGEAGGGGEVGLGAKQTGTLQEKTIKRHRHRDRKRERYRCGWLIR